MPKLSRDVCLGKGSGGTLTTLRYSFYLFSAARRKVYMALLSEGGYSFDPLLMSMSEASSVLSLEIRIFATRSSE